MARDKLTDEVARMLLRRVFGIKTSHEVKDLVDKTIGGIAIWDSELKLVLFTSQHESARMPARGDSEDTAIGKKATHWYTEGLHTPQRSFERRVRGKSMSGR